MTYRTWRRILSPVLVPLTRVCHQVDPNLITFVALGLAIGAGLSFACSTVSVGLVLLALHVVADYLDGAVARASGRMSKLGNFLVFNNGFHTVHHEAAGQHWSLAPAAHAKIAAEIDPALCQQSIFGFCLKSYLLGLFSERFKTKQVGRAPYDPPDGRVLNLQTAEVQAAEAGVNASIA